MVTVVDLSARRAAKAAPVDKLTADLLAEYTRLLQSVIIEAETGINSGDPMTYLDNVREIMDKFWPARPTGGRFA